MSEFSSSGDDPSAVRQGTLLKLPRGKPSIFRSSSPWQERDFVLDIGKGTLSYYQKGQAGIRKGFKGELRLAGGLIKACGEPVSGQKYVFELNECVDEDGGIQPLKLAAATQGEMEAWIVSIRATMKKHGAAAMKHSRPLGAMMEAQEEKKNLMQGANPNALSRGQNQDIDEQMRQQHAQKIDAEEVYAMQNQTMNAVGRIKAQLDDTQQLAATTGETLDQQGEQLDAINDDLDKLNTNVDRADKNFNQLEKWRIFGGHSKKRGAKAAKQEREKVEKQNAKFEAQREAKTTNFDDRSGGGKSSKIAHRNVTSGLQGRDDEEQATLDTIARNDDQINAGLDDIDSMLDSLGDAARSLGDKTRAHNEKINLMTQNMDDASSGVAKINERASYNVRYLS